MKIDTLADLYLEQIRDMHSCERQMINAIPKMVTAASHPALKKAFAQDLERTDARLQRLYEILGELGEHDGGKVCAAAAGLIKEVDEVLENRGDEEARDAGLICAAQKFKHYAIASYGCLRTYASMLNRGEEARLLEETLEDEKDADVALTDLAMSDINDAALAGPKSA